MNTPSFASSLSSSVREYRMRVNRMTSAKSEPRPATIAASTGLICNPRMSRNAEAGPDVRENEYNIPKKKNPSNPNSLNPSSKGKMLLLVKTENAIA